MKRKKYMTVTEAVQYLLGKEEQIEAETLESITYENGVLTFTFKGGSKQTISVVSEPLEVEDIKALTDEQLENLKAGDIVLKLTNDTKHTYIVTYKEERVRICLSYFDYGYAETVSYDYDSEVEAWSLNDVEKLNIKQELDNVKDDVVDVKADIEELRTNKQDKLTAGSGITIDPKTNEISSDGVTYTAGTNINIDSNNKISCTVDTSNFVEKLVPTGTSDIYDQYRTKIERELYDYGGHQNAKGIRNKAYQREYLAGQTKYSETYLGTKDGNDYEFKELIFSKSGTPSYTDATNVAYKILNKHSLTESINNKYKKVYNTSNDSYSETFKYTDSSNRAITVTKEPFKYIGSGEGVLSDDVTIDTGTYEVTKVIVKDSSNVTLMESTVYKGFLMTTYFDVKLYQDNVEIIAFDGVTRIEQYQYNISTTPKTLISHSTYEMTQQS